MGKACVWSVKIMWGKREIPGVGERCGKQRGLWHEQKKKKQLQMRDEQSPKATLPVGNLEVWRGYEGSKGIRVQYM